MFDDDVLTPDLHEDVARLILDHANSQPVSAVKPIAHISSHESPSSGDTAS